MATCKYCGEEIDWGTTCDECLSAVRRESGKQSHKNDGIYAIKALDSCFVEPETATKAIECARFLIDNFAIMLDTEQLVRLADKLETSLMRLGTISLERDYLLNHHVWKKDGRHYVSKIIERHYLTSPRGSCVLKDWELYHAKRYEILPLIQDFIPSDLLLWQIIEHLKNGLNAKDPMGFKKLTHAMLSLAIVKEFEKEYKDYLI